MSDVPTFTVNVYPGDTSDTFTYEVTIDYPPDAEHSLPRRWLSGRAPLNATTALAARAEARERALMMMAMVQGARVESLAPHGINDHGEATA